MSWEKIKQILSASDGKLSARKQKELTDLLTAKPAFDADAIPFQMIIDFMRKQKGPDLFSDVFYDIVCQRFDKYQSHDGFTPFWLMVDMEANDPSKGRYCYVFLR